MDGSKGVGMFLRLWFLGALAGFVTLLLTKPHGKKVTKKQILMVVLISLGATMMVASGVWQAVSGFVLSISDALLSGD